MKYLYKSNTENNLHILTQKLFRLLVLVFTMGLTINAQEIGDVYQDGYIFHISDDESEVLLAAIEDLPEMLEWGCYGDWLSSTTGTSIGSGLQNTLNISSSCSESNIAASLVLEYESENYDDWYLPSKLELKEIYNTLGNGGASGNIGGFGNGNPNYWSSTQQTSDWSWFVDFNNGAQYYGNKYQNYKVRPIRSAQYIEVLGCTDETACNYDSDDSCTYPEEGKNCDGEYVIGLEAFGGIIYHVNDSGTGGLVVRSAPLSTYAQWGCYEFQTTASSILLGNGLTNSLLIDAECFESGIAAERALNHSENGYEDWFLPTVNSFYQMISSTVIEQIDFNQGRYWSSTQLGESALKARVLRVEDESIYVSTNSKYLNGWVLPIRAFGELIEGCMNDNACNYNSNAEFDDGSCTYAEEYYDCDGVCTADADADGICDELEFQGCMDEAACNYADLATDSGDCTYAEEGKNCDGEYMIGTEAFGGIIFHINESGTGILVCTSEVISTTRKFGCQNVYLENTNHEGVGFGYHNTTAIIQQCNTWNCAAVTCGNFEDGEHTDWYLPSVQELELVGNLVLSENILSLENSTVWSSTQIDTATAYSFKMSTGEFQNRLKSNEIGVLAIRKVGDWNTGCMAATACNYDGSAEFDDGVCDYAVVNYDCEGVCLNDSDNDGVCDIYEVIGCVDVSACNYDSDATDSGECTFAEENLDCTGACINDVDEDGVCDEFELEGCMDATACNYDVTATDSGDCYYAVESYDCEGVCLSDIDADGICDALEIEGCTDSIASNYNIAATDDDATCEYQGCTDSAACNFNPAANLDDDSCEIPEYGVDCDGNYIVDACHPYHIENGYYADFFGVSPIFEEIMDTNDTVLITQNGVTHSFIVDYNGFGDYEGCYDSEGNYITLTINVLGDLSDTFGENVMPGALVEVLEYIPIYGCNDEEALNYNDEATENDGTCEFEICGLDLNYADADLLNNFISAGQEAPYPYQEYIPSSSGYLDWVETLSPHWPNQTTIQMKNIVGEIVGIYASEHDENAEGGAVLKRNTTESPVYVVGGEVYTLEIISGGAYFTTENIYQGALNSAGSGWNTDEVGWGDDYGTTGDLLINTKICSLLPGCMDLGASNYNIDALVDNGSCNYPVLGCMDESACNFQETATVDDASCTYAEENYDCDGVCLSDTDADGICDALEIIGCQDETACNYDAYATDTGSCTYTEEYYDCSGVCIVDSDADGVCDALEVVGCMDLSACNYDDIATDADACTYAEEYYDCENNCLEDIDADGVCDALEIEGCTDSTAGNYNALATEDDGDCVDGVFGCTSQAYQNYNPGANIDDGSCANNYADMLAVIWQAYDILQSEYELCTPEMYGSVSIQLYQGWNMIGYNLIYPTDMVAQLAPIQESVKMVKNNAGDVYWSEFGFNGIGDFEPGQGYQIRMIDEAQLNFEYTDLKIGLTTTVPQWAYDLPLIDSSTNEKQLIRIVDVLGREIDYQEGVKLDQVIFKIYSDGSVQKVLTSEL